MNHHFDKSRRLLTKRDYEYVFKDAEKLATPHFVILYRENTKGHARLGMALSRRVIPKAHDRNRMKRFLRETFRTAEALPAVDIVVLAKPGILKAEALVVMHKLEQTWNKLWQKRGIHAT